MIKPEAIKFLEKDAGDHHRALIAGLKLETQFTYSKHTTSTPAEMQSMVRETMKRAIMHELYGDLVRPVHELLSLAARNLQPHQHDEFRQLDDRINELLGSVL